MTAAANPDDRSHEVGRRVDRNARTLAVRSAAGAFVLACLLQLSLLGGPIVALIGPLGVALAVVLHAIALRMGVISPVDRAFGGRGYDRVRRWMIRLGYFTMAPWGYGLMLTPIFGLAAGPLTAAGLTWAIRTYVLWTFAREQRGLGPHTLEKALVVMVALALLASVALLVVVAAAVGWLASWVGGA